MSQNFMVPGSYNENIAYVEDGDTASRNYSVGEFVTWNGVLHSVTAAIAQGESFVLGTNVQDESSKGGINSLKETMSNKRYDIDNETVLVIDSTNYRYTANKNVLLVINSNSNVNSYIDGYFNSNGSVIHVEHIVDGYNGVNDKIELHAGDAIEFVTNSANAWKCRAIPIV